MKKFALVLGGGAAKGYAHIGVLRVLETYGLKPDLIVGTSMGALVGGLYASGMPCEKLESLALSFDSIGKFNLFSLLFQGSIINVNKVKKLITNNLGDKKHEDCDIEFVAISTELNTGLERRFCRGKLSDSIMASISIPGVFPNIHIDDNVYCDGGIVNNLPEDVAKEFMPDGAIISVDVIGKYSAQVETMKIKTMETILNASTLMTTNVINKKPKKANLRLTLSMPNVSQMDFSKKAVNLAITEGERVTQENIDKILKILKEKK